MRNKLLKIENAMDFEDVSDEMISDFMDSLPFGELKRKPTKADRDEFGSDLSWMFTQRAMQLYWSYCSKLKRLGEKLFPNEEIRIKGSAVIFP